MFAPKHGTLSYPTDTATFANNAADLVELRVKPLTSATAFRVTLNTLIDRRPHGVHDRARRRRGALSPGRMAPASRSPAQLFLTVHGTTAELRDARGRGGHDPAPTATRRPRPAGRSTSGSPHAAWDPGTRTVRMTAGVGLWDTGRRAPTSSPGRSRRRTAPGGAAPRARRCSTWRSGPTSRVPHIYDPGTANTIVEGHVGVRPGRRRGGASAARATSWPPVTSRLRRAGGLRASSPARSTDESGGPAQRPPRPHLRQPLRLRAGRRLRREVHHEPRRHEQRVHRPPPRAAPALRALRPAQAASPAEGFGLVVSMHGLSANYNEFLGSHEAEQLGERGTGSIVASPEARGPDGSYKSYAEADVFEMWADVARHYRLNPDDDQRHRATRWAAAAPTAWPRRWPDLFGARVSRSSGRRPRPDSFTSLRNVPVMAWYGQPGRARRPGDERGARS